MSTDSLRSRSVLIPSLGERAITLKVIGCGGKVRISVKLDRRARGDAVEVREKLGDPLLLV